MNTIDYFHCSPNVTLQTEAHATPTVERSGQRLDLDQIAVTVMDALVKLPDSSQEELLVDIILMTGKQFSPVRLGALLCDLEARDLIVRTSRPPRLSMPYPIDHTCAMCGCSCMAQLVGPLSDGETQNILDAHRQLSGAGAMSPTLNPIMKGIKRDGTSLCFVNYPDKRCAFLDENQRCMIHASLGPDHKPAACRRFPCIAIATESEIRLGIKPYCYNNDRVCRLEPCGPQDLESYRLNHPDELDDLVQNAAFRPIIRLADEAERLQARIQEAQMLSWLQSPMTYPALLASLVGGRRSSLDIFPKAFLQDVHRALVSLAPDLQAEVAKLGDTVHARHARDFCALLSAPLVNFACLAPEDPFARYARFAVHQVVFLRETSRFPSISLGAFVFALGGLVAAQDPTHGATHLTAWMRLVAQTKAFELLCPTPQAMIALTRNLV